MRIVVDVNHPAHVHLFKNFIWKMEEKGHDVTVTATDKDVTISLLENYGFKYVNLGNYGKTLLEKAVNIPVVDLKMYNAVKGFNPDIFVGMGSIRAAHVSFMLRKKSINFEDTEHSMEQIRLYLPFVSTVCTPSCFKRDLGRKQVSYDGFHELAYLYPGYFDPDPTVLDSLGVSKDDRFIVLRLVSWKATHDVGQHGIRDPVKFVRELEKYGKVLITSEGGTDVLKEYEIKVPPHRIHDVLYYASMYIGEGATMATEAALLGTPSIYISSLAKSMGNFEELERKYGLVYSYDDSVKALVKIKEIFQAPDPKGTWRARRDALIRDKTDVTGFMVRLIENYPDLTQALNDNTPGIPVKTG